jgi:protein O-mannosyl-transferase
MSKKAMQATPKAVTTELPAAWQRFIQDKTKPALVLFLFTFILYGNTLWHEYTQDDAIVITDNMFTQQGLSGIPGLFKYDTFYGFFKEEGKAALVAGGRYRPLTPMMFAIETELFGLNPFWGHFFNILWFGFCVWVLFRVFSRMFSQRWPKGADTIAFIAALLFAAHPIHTEAVANIKGRDEIMAMILSLATLGFSLRAVDEKKSIWAWVASLTFLAGLLAKENTITFLAVIPLSFWVFRQVPAASYTKVVLPLLLVTGLFLWARTSVIGQFFGGEPPKELMNNPFLKLENGTYVPFSNHEKSATISFVLGKYLQLMSFPHPLTHDYYPRQVDIMGWDDMRVIASALVYLLLLIWSFRFVWKNKNIYAYSILYYLITLSIVSNIIFPVGTNLSERFLFMPSAGWLIIPAYWAYDALLLRRQYRWFIFIIGSVLFLYAIKTIDRNRVWESNETLFLNDVSLSPRSAKLQNAAGGEKTRLAGLEKDSLKKEQLLTEAIAHLETAISIHPGYKNAFLLMGNAHYYKGAYEESIRAYESALQLDPNYADALANIGLAYQQAGKYAGEVENNLPKAIQLLEKGLSYLPEDYEIHRLLGIAYAIGNQPAKALPHFIKATEIQPEIPDAWQNLGNVYGQLGDVNKAASFISKAAEMKKSGK